MENTEIIENLISFGLTRQEAQIYLSLLSHGEMTGYEVSKETGISRSNAYASLSGLVEKGAAYLIESNSTKYTPVNIKNFLSNTLDELQQKALFLQQNTPEKIITTEGYITIKGTKNIKNKIKQMLSETRLRLYILASSSLLKEFEQDLIELTADGKKVVILTDNNYQIPNAKNYNTEIEQGQLRFITDSTFVLTGELNNTTNDNCLYSGQKNLVEVMKEALKNKISLIE